MIDERQQIRPHIKFFVDREMCRELGADVSAAGELVVVAALSGG